MSLRARCAAILLVALLMAGPARACPVCVVGPGLSPAQQLMNADAVLLVAPDRGGWRTVEVIKGALAAIPAGALPVDDTATPAAGAMVALRDPMSKWKALGALPPAHLPWLKQVAAGRGTAQMSDADWRERVRFHLPTLEHPVPLIAETAYAEVARAPYVAMRAAKPQLDAARLHRWLDDPALTSRRSLYTLLLGIAGGNAATQWVERQLVAAERDPNASELAALLVADLELHGPGRLPWIEQTYLADPGQWQPGLQAVLLALSEQGSANAAVPRAGVVDVYRRFIQRGHALAGYVAADLLRWQDWSAVSDYAELIRSGARQQPASTYAMLGYLVNAPLPEARAAAAALKQRAAQP